MDPTSLFLIAMVAMDAVVVESTVGAHVKPDAMPRVVVDLIVGHAAPE